MDGILSLIVIGRNEAKTLGSVFARFKELSARLDGRAQLIYVDSDSKDSSVAIAQAFRRENPACSVRIVQIKGQFNCAIARNIGMRFLGAETEFIFFLDGDIVFDVAFVPAALAALWQEQAVGSVCGLITDSFDGAKGDVVPRGNARIGESWLLRWHGGNFITRKAILDQVGPFDERLMRHQDIDYALRMRSKGYRLRLLAQDMGVHHTTSYLNRERLWRDLMRGNFLCSGLLVRKHLFSRRCPDALRAVWRIAFRCGVLCCAVLAVFCPVLAIPAVLGVLAVLARTRGARRETLLSRALSFVAGIQFLAGFLACRPRRVFHVQVM